jgi:hypothetical protein
MDISHTRTIYFPLLTYSTIWLNIKSTVAEQYDLRERECHVTCYHQTNDWNVAIFGPGQEMTWRQWSGEINVTCMYWQIYTIHQQQKVTFVTNMETLWSHKLYRTITSIWGTLTKVTEWPPVTQSNGGHRSGKKKTIFPPVRHDYREQLPPPDIMWCQNDTQELPTCPHTKLDWKCWEFTLSPSSHWQTSCRWEKSYSARGKFQQSLANSFLQSELSHLLCMRDTKGSASKMQRVWCGAVNWWVFQSVPQEIQIVMYWRVLVGFEATKHLTKQVCKIIFVVFCNAFRWAKCISTEAPCGSLVG